MNLYACSSLKINTRFTRVNQLLPWKFTCLNRGLSAFTDSNTTGADITDKFHPSTTGLGSAVIQSHYGRLGLGCQPADFLKTPKTVSVIGAPMSSGQPRAGTDHGAQILRDCGLDSTLISLGWRLHEQGDLEFASPREGDPTIESEGHGKGNAINSFCVGQGLKKIFDKVHDAASAGDFALVLGGDHSISAGSVAGILRARPDCGVIWVDAHGDINTPLTSPSGNMHGMPLGILMGHYDPMALPGWEWMADVPKLKPEQLAFVGLRDLDAGERNIIRKYNIKAFTMFDIDRYGIGSVMDMVLKHLDGRPLHLSYDIDAVDPEIAPSTGTVVRGGLNYREAHYVAEILACCHRLGSMDLVEINPTLSTGIDSQNTAQLGMALIASAMGSSIL